MSHRYSGTKVIVIMLSILSLSYGKAHLFSPLTIVRNTKVGTLGQNSHGMWTFQKLKINTTCRPQKLKRNTIDSREISHNILLKRCFRGNNIKNVSNEIILKSAFRLGLSSCWSHRPEVTFMQVLSFLIVRLFGSQNYCCE